MAEANSDSGGLARSVRKRFPARMLLVMAAGLALFGPAISHEGELWWGMFGVQLVRNFFSEFPLFPIVYLVYVTVVFGLLALGVGLYALARRILRGHPPHLDSTLSEDPNEDKQS